MKPLEYPDEGHLITATGWLELGMPIEADKELDEITPEHRAHPEVLRVRCDVYFAMKKWDHVVTLSETLVQMWPKKPSVWIQRSFALHELGRTREAFEKLEPAARRFRKIWTIPYNLACYCAQLGQMEACREWFKQAMATDERAVRESAIDDPDLKPLWDSMSGTLWKREEG